MRLFITHFDSKLQIFKVVDERMPVTTIGMNFHLSNGDTMFIHPQNVVNLVLMSEEHYDEWLQKNQQAQHEQELEKIEKEKLAPKIIS